MIINDAEVIRLLKEHRIIIITGTTEGRNRLREIVNRNIDSKKR